jgi:NADPH:quinone reductase-like Zn-dependent oxidoreductase
MASFIQSMLPFRSVPAASLPDVNKQWTTAFDGIDKLKFTEGKVPQPKDGEVLVKVLAVSLNYRDVEGEFAPLRAERVIYVVSCHGRVQSSRLHRRVRAVGSLLRHVRRRC